MRVVILQPDVMDDKQLEQFLPHVEHCDVSQEMKMQILRDLWSVMESFAYDAWELRPPQRSAKQNTQAEFELKTDDKTST